MGNTNPHPIFNILTPWSDKTDLINLLQEHNNSIGCNQSVIKNTNKRLEILCDQQQSALRKFYNANKKAKEESKDPLPRPDICKGKIVALPKTDPLSCKTVWYITQVIDHTCVEKSCQHNTNAINDSIQNAASKIKDKLRGIHDLNTKHVGSLLSNEYKMNQESSKNIPYYVKHRVAKQVMKENYGDVNTQYSCLIHILELMKQFDEDSKILLKVFADKEDIIVRKGTRGKPATTTSNFALRYGSVVVIPGTTIRRNGMGFKKRKVYTADGTHIKSKMRGSIQSVIAAMANAEEILHCYSVDAQNEGNHAWNFIFSAADEFKILKDENNSNFSPMSQVIVCDRLKGQNSTTKRILPYVPIDNCLLHLGMNLHDHKM